MRDNKGDEMRFECDGCRVVAVVKLGKTPKGWKVEFTRDRCATCKKGR